LYSLGISRFAEDRYLGYADILPCELIPQKILVVQYSQITFRLLGFGPQAWSYFATFRIFATVTQVHGR